MSELLWGYVLSGFILGVVNFWSGYWCGVLIERRRAALAGEEP